MMFCDFTSGMVSDSGAMGPQYGSKDAMCAIMTTQDADIDPITAFANWTISHFGPDFGSNCYYSTKCLSNSKYSDQWAGGLYAWVWQCCSELGIWLSIKTVTRIYTPIMLIMIHPNAKYMFQIVLNLNKYLCCSCGCVCLISDFIYFDKIPSRSFLFTAYWQVASPGSIRSQLLDLNYYNGQCQAAFGPSTFPETVAFNSKFGGAHPTGVTRVIALQVSCLIFYVVYMYIM